MKVNGTSAKNIAIHFLDKTVDRYTPSLVAKTIIQAKSLLKSKYTEEEIIKTIDYIVDKTDVNMYSLGYVASAINDVLSKIDQEEKEYKIKEVLREMEKEIQVTSEEEIDVKSRERNKRKVEGFGSEPRKRKEPYSDLFE